MSVLLPVILSGGSGTRLWPLSRQAHPKQFLALNGEQTMLQQTATRLQGLDGGLQLAPAPLVVCHEKHRFLAASQLQDVGMQGSPLLLEPVSRNTAPALTLAALQACSDGSDPVLLAMPADHVVADRLAFHRAVQQAHGAASEGHIVTFGVVPTHAETGFGYIQLQPGRAAGAPQPVLRFVEKPDLATAQRYLQEGQHLWNSGLFMLRASVWLRAIGHFHPAILVACQAAMRAVRNDLDFIRPDAKALADCPADSIDYAVMEALPRTPALGIPASVITFDAGWSDLGTWHALWGHAPQDPAGNALIGKAVVQQGCSDSLLLSSGRLLAGVGLHQLVVIETPDAVLVADKRHTQDVRQLVDQLNTTGHDLTHTHRKVHRPWGWYDSIDGGERFQVKRIVVNPGAALSLQLHHHRAEHWVVVRGTAHITKGDDSFVLLENQSTYIPPGQPHRLANPGKVPLEIIEVQSGSYLGEDDIVRLSDDYGRA